MKTITADELKARIDAGEQLNIVDVREPAEHEEFNIGGILFPVGRFRAMDTAELDHLKDQEVIFYCCSGNRSGNACLFAEQMGFTNVVNLAGGMITWREKFDQ